MSYRTELIQIAAVALAAIQNLDTGGTSDGFEMERYAEEAISERKRQYEKWGNQSRTPETWLVILMEEVGEAAKDVLEDNLK